MNVLNLTDLEGSLKIASARAGNPKVKTWVFTVARNYIINPEGADAVVEYADYDPRPPRKGRKSPMPTKDQLPEWARTALDRGTPIHFFKSVQPRNRELWQKLDVIVDWFNSWSKDDPSWQRVDRISWHQAVDLSQKWFVKICENPWKHAKEKNLQTVMTFKDGWSWVRMHEDKHLQREGSLMKHCVGSGGYVSSMRSGEAHFYSLRDDENMPHITIEAHSGKDGVIHTRQIKGNCNQKPSPQYQVYLREFIKKKKIQISGDSHMVDMNG